ncbi:unnamed protein product [Eruca vesicaria subsp. sativa]|uniref:RING-type E3 ubiquitin transferase n=1 Tax=Eruca vesicaria subsp. sativa TaxID=29727 RepID=A0ABC8KZL1_ERUVS|nr:unnamed protein product [Eruca vesicaria subsp. sativa]
MLRGTNSEQVLDGEVSSSHPEMQRLSSLVEDDEAEPVEEVRSGTLLDLDLLDCPVCCHALTNPIFQCDNGHIACSSCCVSLRNKCPSCALPIGVYRNRLAEKILEAVNVPCPNVKHGCTNKFSYGKELAHEKECSFALCYCPEPDCNYSGLCNNLYSHYYVNHSGSRLSFTCGYNRSAWMHISDKILFLQERREGPLVAVQCFEEEQGVYVTVNCIAPCAPGVSEFSFELFYSSYFGEKTMSFGLREMNRIQKVSFETPEKDFMFVPHYFMAGRPDLKMHICIRRRGEEQEKKT